MRNSAPTLIGKWLIVDLQIKIASEWMSLKELTSYDVLWDSFRGLVNYCGIWEFKPNGILSFYSIRCIENPILKNIPPIDRVYDYDPQHSILTLIAPENEYDDYNNVQMIFARSNGYREYSLTWHTDDTYPILGYHKKRLLLRTCR